ncbi:hypothetical protein Acsp03_09340 [Actinomadura sp. NBRC 104412]|uniref:hypothetical protein n=1 Tax=Actinomadura sp. NBRC 104412 TaxID=3032203 RepID=UPI0024A50933|nr:hypothetical protein [Actinomadura sp. NBRC 104412]GLZ03467.1 hypothetical protein Acsp03_09340 [Actinomadura sp. NBRC 104412]
MGAGDTGSARGRARVPRRTASIAVAAGLTVCVLGGLGLAGARPGDGPSGASGAAREAVAPPDRNAIGAVLANRARAVRERDRIAFMATLASAPAPYRQAQAVMFDNLLRLPLRDWREDFTSLESAGGGAALVRIRLTYALRGHDAEPVARTRYLAFAPRPGGWAVVGDGTARGRTDDAEIWDGGPLTVVRGRSALVIGDAPGLREIARRLDAAVPAVTAVSGRLAPSGWARRVVALVPADPARAASLAGGRPDLHEIAALATVAPTAGGRGADRIVIAPAAFGRLNALGRDVVLTHELTHVATGGARDGRTPIWLIEGFADYAGYRGRDVSVRSAAAELRREVAAGRLPEALPGRAAFDGGSPRLSQAYQESWLACRMIAERYGEAALVRLYRAAGRSTESAALRETLGLDLPRFTAAWRDYLRRELR